MSKSLFDLRNFPAYFIFLIVGPPGKNRKLKGIDVTLDPFLNGGKRPLLPTPIPTPSGSSESTSSSSHQEEENDPFESLKFLQRQLYLVDHVMIPLSERRFFKIMLGGKRPRIPTPIPTPSGSSESTSSSSHQEEENDLVNNFTLKLIPYINQLPPIEGGESHEFKQTKGMFKCFGHFLSNLGKKKK
ncbi:hypothetical protein Tco_1542697 [Tanacetum coccineum]